MTRERQYFIGLLEQHINDRMQEIEQLRKLQLANANLSSSKINKAAWVLRLENQTKADFISAAEAVVASELG